MTIIKLQVQMQRYITICMNVNMTRAAYYADEVTYFVSFFRLIVELVVIKMYNYFGS